MPTDDQPAVLPAVRPRPPGGRLPEPEPAALVPVVDREREAALVAKFDAIYRNGEPDLTPGEVARLRQLTDAIEAVRRGEAVP